MLYTVMENVSNGNEKDTRGLGQCAAQWLRMMLLGGDWGNGVKAVRKSSAYTDAIIWEYV